MLSKLCQLSAILFAKCIAKELHWTCMFSSSTSSGVQKSAARYHCADALKRSLNYHCTDALKRSLNYHHRHRVDMIIWSHVCLVACPLSFSLVCSNFPMHHLIIQCTLSPEIKCVTHSMHRYQNVLGQCHGCHGSHKVLNCSC